MTARASHATNQDPPDEAACQLSGQLDHLNLFNTPLSLQVMIVRHLKTIVLASHDQDVPELTPVARKTQDLIVVFCCLAQG